MRKKQVYASIHNEFCFNCTVAILVAFDVGRNALILGAGK